jgi:hypothetical protein
MSLKISRADLTRRIDDKDSLLLGSCKPRWVWHRLSGRLWASPSRGPIHTADVGFRSPRRSAPLPSRAQHLSIVPPANRARGRPAHPRLRRRGAALCRSSARVVRHRRPGCARGRCHARDDAGSTVRRARHLRRQRRGEGARYGRPRSGVHQGAAPPLQADPRDRRRFASWRRSRGIDISSDTPIRRSCDRHRDPSPCSAIGLVILDCPLEPFRETDPARKRASVE